MGMGNTNGTCKTGSGANASCKMGLSAHEGLMFIGDYDPYNIEP